MRRRGQTHHSQVGEQESTGVGGEDSQDEEEETKPITVRWVNKSLGVLVERTHRMRRKRPNPSQSGR